MWIVKISRKADKQKEKLPERVKSTLLFLMHEISRNGPVRGDCRITANFHPGYITAISKRENLRM